MGDYFGGGSDGFGGGGSPRSVYSLYLPIHNPSGFQIYSADTLSSGWPTIAGSSAPATRISLVAATRCVIDRPVRVSGAIVGTTTAGTAGVESSLNFAWALFNSDGLLANTTQTALPTTYVGGILPANAITVAAARAAYNSSAARNDRGLLAACTAFDVPIGVYYFLSVINAVYTGGGTPDTAPSGHPDQNGSVPWATDASSTAGALGDDNALPRNLIFDTAITSALSTYATWSDLGVVSQSAAAGKWYPLAAGAGGRTLNSGQAFTNTYSQDWAWRLVCDVI